MRPVKELWATWTRRRQQAEEARNRRRQEADEAQERRRQFERRHRLRLENAAGVSSLPIVCHQDTWRFVEKTVFPRVRYPITFPNWV